MNIASPIQQNSAHFLRQIEGLLLMGCGSMALYESFSTRSIPVQHLLILATLGLMGRFSPQRTIAKVSYTVIEIGLIFYGTWLGYLHILPVLYLIVVIRGCFLFKPLGRQIIAGLAFCMFLLHHFQYNFKVLPYVLEDGLNLFWMHQFSEIVIFFLSIVFAVQFVNQLALECQRKEALTLAQTQLRAYAIRVEHLAAMQERNRIARDIHDAIGHNMVILLAQLQAAYDFLNLAPERVESCLARSVELARNAMKEIHHSVRELEADHLKEPKSLAATIYDLATEFSHDTQISISTQIEPDLSCGLLPMTVKEGIYRTVQEALTNVVKHAQATSVLIHVASQQEGLALTIEDNGKGFDIASGARDGFGLRSMEERVHLIEGKFQIKTKPGQGCCIRIEVPLGA
jgi:signal transduction histidine kinase